MGSVNIGLAKYTWGPEVDSQHPSKNPHAWRQELVKEYIITTTTATIIR